MFIFNVNYYYMWLYVANMVVLMQPILGLKAPLYCTVKMYGGLLRDVIPRNNKVLSLRAP